MTLTSDKLNNRLDQLEESLTRSKTDLEIVKEKSKILKQEIANTKGAILEIERLIEGA